MHSGENYMSLPPSKQEKIEDAKVWVSYIYKGRSKPASGEVYSASRRWRGLNARKNLRCVGNSMSALATS
jgi:hypothetical protein